MRAAAVASGAAALQGLFLTHLHSDHITDLNDVFTMRWVTSFAPSPLSVFGHLGPPRRSKPSKRCSPLTSATGSATTTI